MNAVLPRLPRLVCKVVGILVLGLGLVAGCARTPLLDRQVEATSADELASFRLALGSEFPAVSLREFDTALQELKLEAMNRGVAGVAAREEQMRNAVHGKTVRAALVLGWQARCSRLRRELADMTGRLEHDSKLESRAVSSDSKQFFSNLLRNERDLIAQLNRDLAEAEGRLRQWGGEVAIPAAAPEAKQE